MNVLVWQPCSARPTATSKAPPCRTLFRGLRTSSKVGFMSRGLRPIQFFFQMTFPKAEARDRRSC